MAGVPGIIPINDLRQDAAAVLLSLEAYERSERERQLLQLLARGEQEIKAGKGFDLDEVLAEANKRIVNCKL